MYISVLVSDFSLTHAIERPPMTGGAAAVIMVPTNHYNDLYVCTRTACHRQEFLTTSLFFHDLIT